MQNNHDEKSNQWPCVQKLLLFYKIQLICDACDKIDFDFPSTECPIKYKNVYWMPENKICHLWMIYAMEWVLVECQK